MRERVSPCLAALSSEGGRRIGIGMAAAWSRSLSCARVRARVRVRGRVRVGLGLGLGYGLGLGFSLLDARLPLYLRISPYISPHLPAPTFWMPGSSAISVSVTCVLAWLGVGSGLPG